MSLNNRENFMIDMQLIKTIGLNQMLSPHSPKVFKYLTRIQMSILVIMFVVFVLNIYYRTDDLNVEITYFILVVACAHSIYKMYSIIRNADMLWSCIQMTSVECFSYKYHRRQMIEISRTKSISLPTVFSILWVVSTIIWIISPLFNYVRVIHEIGKENIGNYQYNVLNLVFPVTVKFYNEHFIYYYLLESMLTVIWNHALLIFDIITMSMCTVFSYQLKTIFNSYRIFGMSTAAFIGTNNRKIVMDEREKSKLEIYYFKILIQDQQKIISNMRNVYKILRPVVLFQILTDSSLIILLSSLITMNYINGTPLMSSINVRYMMAVSSITLRLYILCYLFSDVDEQKNVINFGLYSSDWTEKNICFKKLILYAMRMNNAENLKLQISINKKVNVELFKDIMRTTYSILSVLANQYKPNM